MERSFSLSLHFFLALGEDQQLQEQFSEKPNNSCAYRLIFTTLYRSGIGDLGVLQAIPSL